MPDSGDPRCTRCHGKGGSFTNGKWRKCVCLSGTVAGRAAVRRMNSIGTEFRLPWHDKPEPKA